MTPQKHADLIHAWADGAEIQIFYDDTWHDACNPAFYEGMAYRIKPQKKILWGRYSKSIDWVNAIVYKTEEEARASIYGDYQVFSFEVEV